jgi:hypothetical protein
MNVELSLTFGESVARLPLTHSAKIVCANALRIDWNDVLPADECSYVLGNPPFVGKKEQDKSQKADMSLVWEDTKGVGVLDYVTAWYKKAAEYTSDRAIRVAFVSTNSVTQGEQAGILWPALREMGLCIEFAHRTFPWSSEARGKAHVHVVIIGFARHSPSAVRLIYEYGSKGEPIGVVSVGEISPYLSAGPMLAVTNRSRPASAVPSMNYGSMQNDGGHLIIDEAEVPELVSLCPAAKPFVRRFFGSHDLLHNEPRYCLWLVDAPPNLLREMPPVIQRVERVRTHRLKSTRETTRRLATTPALFGEIRQPKARYLAVPRTSSERRTYIPLAFLDSDVIANTDLLTIEDATLFHFGVLHSEMHMAWVRQICGRLKSDFRYSATLVYNNFPWPESVDAKQRAAVEQAAHGVLDARAEFPDATLADLYDPLAMPKPLRDAHATLDRAVDRCYRAQPFPDERRRFEFLFAMWERLNNPLTASTTKKKPRRKKAT